MHTSANNNPIVSCAIIFHHMQCVEIIRQEGDYITASEDFSIFKRLEVGEHPLGVMKFSEVMRGSVPVRFGRHVDSNRKT